MGRTIYCTAKVCTHPYQPSLTEKGRMGGPNICCSLRFMEPKTSGLQSPTRTLQPLPGFHHMLPTVASPPWTAPPHTHPRSFEKSSSVHFSISREMERVSVKLFVSPSYPAFTPLTSHKISCFWSFSSEGHQPGRLEREAE